ncbi:MAG: thioredoxin family protein [Robiginitomaculum sp.]|nr:thioredoxin family protein [Robiginitomaculum sp.]
MYILRKSMVMMKFLKLLCVLVFALLGANTSANAQQRPDMYVVMFRADWCAPCKIVEPNLDRALKTLGDPGIQFINIDITDPFRSERSAHLAFDAAIVKQYNQWYGTTGFAAMIDADTKNTLGCVNLMYDVGAMVAHIKNLKTHALTNQPGFDITCPGPTRVGG